ncbi:MAG: hypothetical protein IJ728_08865 [Selenomonadaceae bacterium]|nr:hypothetical protein [Selenomonadaceae bacterium]
MSKWKTWNEYLENLSHCEREAIDFRMALSEVMTEDVDADDDAIFGTDFKRVLELLHKYGKTLAIVPMEENENV